MYGQICGSICLMHRNAKKSKSGPSRNQSSTMSENCVVFTSLGQMMKNLNKRWRMRGESWKFRCQQQCFADFNVVRTGKPVAQLKNTRQKKRLYCWSRWIYEEKHERISSRESWRSYCRKRYDFIESLSLGAQIYSYASSCEHTRCKGSSG